MIVQMKKNSTKQEYMEVIAFLEANEFEIKDVSTEGICVFWIVGDTASIDPRDLYAFEGVKEATRVLTPFKKASRSFKQKNTIIKLKNGTEIGGSAFTVIAGPCAVESREQLLTIAKSIKKAGANVLRAGAYKPRTSPYAFQGLEEEGLKLLSEVGKEIGLPVISEIPSAELIPLFEEHVDIIQVGARNMQNFHLLTALGKIKTPILLKRGFAATIDEWLLAAEYILAQGNQNVVLCERGIRTFERYTRNTLDISSVLVVQELSHLPVLVDPSHASGRWDMVEKLSLASLAVGANGLMIETHEHPQNALSDGAQSLKLKNFDRLMRALMKILNALG